jgi:hypothetical protein
MPERTRVRGDAGHHGRRVWRAAGHRLGGMLYFADMTQRTTRIDEAVALLETLPDDEQARVVDSLIALTRERDDYALSDEQLAGIDHAMQQAERGLFVSDAAIRQVLGGSL